MFIPVSDGICPDVNGLISDPTRWSTADSPVTITGNVRVAADATLTIDAGVTVIFKSSSRTPARAIPSK
ncbi:MAG: hypothetical protein R2875_11670 [Desulfobacterales bacterium]